jgi:hypothetical protein
MNTTISIPNANGNTFPEGAKEVLYWRVSDKWYRQVLVGLLALPLFFLSGFIFYQLARLIGGMPEQPSIDRLHLLLSVIIVIPLHEATHGVVMRGYGGKPQYGFIWKGLMFYATCPNLPFQRNDYLKIALAPIVGISVAVICCYLLFFGSDTLPYLVTIGTMNVACSSGDLWIGAIVLRYSASSLVVDERDGVRIFANNSATV